MKNIKFGLAIIAIIVSFSVSAQFKIGLIGGANFANVSGDLSGPKTILGYNVGIAAEVKLPSKYGIEVDVLHSLKGFTLDGVIDFQGNLTEDLDTRLSYIDIPIVFKRYTLKVLSFQLGAQYSFLTLADLDGEDVKSAFKTNDFSIVAGIGIDVKRFHLSARYNFGVLDISNDFGDNLDVKNNMLTLSIGIWLKK